MKPAIFSGESVRAILHGIKTQSRRVVKPQPRTRVWQERTPSGDLHWFGDAPHMYGPRSILHSPFGEPGSTLWVREAHAIESNRGLDSARVYPPPFSDGRPTRWTEDHPEDGPVWEQAHYRATDPSPDLACGNCRCGDGDPHAHWRSPLLLPKWAARIFLRVESVRAERLADITEDDIHAEGVTGYPCVPASAFSTPTCREVFERGWDSLHRGHPERQFAASPWCWVYTLARTEPPE